jgi:hypothetical protein
MLPTVPASRSKVAILLYSGGSDRTMAVSSITNCMGILGSEWKVFVYTKDEASAKELKSIGSLRHHRGRLSVMPLGAPSPLSINDRNGLLTSTWFWEQCPGEKVLMFDATTRLCSGSASSIDDFLEYDYVGAPWPDIDRGPHIFGGNGMLSLRTRSKMLATVTAYTRTEGNEDMWLVEHLQKPDIAAHLANQSVGAQFSVECIPDPSPFGVSYALRPLSTADRKRLLVNCPEARMLAGYLPYADWILHPEQCSTCTNVGELEKHWRTGETQCVPPCPVDCVAEL